jgi:hypothetical protein
MSFMTYMTYCYIHCHIHYFQICLFRSAVKNIVVWQCTYPVCLPVISFLISSSQNLELKYLGFSLMLTVSGWTFTSSVLHICVTLPHLIKVDPILLVFISLNRFCLYIIAILESFQPCYHLLVTGDLARWRRATQKMNIRQCAPSPGDLILNIMVSWQPRQYCARVSNPFICFLLISRKGFSDMTFSWSVRRGRNAAEISVESI